jgi:ASC-1-like (ASCH) protein
MKLQKQPFENILNGKKLIESRLYDEKRQQINLGDQIEFACVVEPTKIVLTKVRALYRYGSFEELFSDFSPDKFGGESKDELLKEIESFYSVEDQKKFGVVGIRIEVIQ